MHSPKLLTGLCQPSITDWLAIHSVMSHKLQSQHSWWDIQTEQDCDATIFLSEVWWSIVSHVTVSCYGVSCHIVMWRCDERHHSRTAWRSVIALPLYNVSHHSIPLQCRSSQRVSRHTVPLRYLVAEQRDSVLHRLSGCLQHSIAQPILDETSYALWPVMFCDLLWYDILQEERYGVDTWWTLWSYHHTNVSCLRFNPDHSVFKPSHITYHP